MDIGLLDRAGGLVFLLLLFYWLKPGKEDKKEEGEKKQGPEKESKKEKENSPRKEDNSRLVFFDFAKGLAIVIVVAIHTGGILPRGSPLERVLWFALPLFVICSGYLLARRYANNFDLGKFFSSTFWRLILPYAAYTIFAGLFLYPRSSFTQMLLDILLGTQNGGTLFFIPLLLQLYALFAILQAWPALRRLALHPVSLMLIFLLSYAISDADHALRAAQWNSHVESLVFAGRYLFYFVIGMWLAGWELEKKKLAKVELALLLSLPLLLLAYDPSGWDQPFVYPVWALLALHLLYRWLKENGLMQNGLMQSSVTWLALIGQYSLIIYMLHPVAISNVLWPLKDFVPFDGWFRYALIAFMALVISGIAGRWLMDGYQAVMKKAREILFTPN